MGIKEKIYKMIPKKIVVETVPILKTDILNDKVILVIGGSGGIGEAIVARASEWGAKVIVHGTNENKLNRIEEKISNTRTISFDLLEFEKYDYFIEKCYGFFGRIDGVALCAGIHGDQNFGRVNSENWDSVMDINCKSPYFMAQSYYNSLIKHKDKGHILFVSSASCTKPGWSPYEISKAAVKSMCLGIADKVVKDDIIVNSIAPGPVATNMLVKNTDNLYWKGNPTGRMASPHEIANLACMLLSDICDMVIGDTFFVSGGSGTICINK